MTTAYIALGSNQDDPLCQIRNALNSIAALPESCLTATSSFWRTPPYGLKNQPDYLNVVVALDTHLTPEALLTQTQLIELKQGRIRKSERWGARTLDLDILLFGSVTLCSERLTLPHYDMQNRAFMLLPLLEIAPDICFPDGRSVAEELAHLDTHDLSLW